MITDVDRNKRQQYYDKEHKPPHCTNTDTHGTRKYRSHAAAFKADCVAMLHGENHRIRKMTVVLYEHCPEGDTLFAGIYCADILS